MLALHCVGRTNCSPLPCVLFFLVVPIICRSAPSPCKVLRLEECFDLSLLYSPAPKNHLPAALCASSRKSTVTLVCHPVFSLSTLCDARAISLSWSASLFRLVPNSSLCRSLLHVVSFSCTVTISDSLTTVVTFGCSSLTIGLDSAPNCL